MFERFLQPTLTRCFKTRFKWSTCIPGNRPGRKRALTLRISSAQESAIHLVYVHGSILRHNPASLVGELSELSQRNVAALVDGFEFAGTSLPSATADGRTFDGRAQTMRGSNTRHLLVRPRASPRAKHWRTLSERVAGMRKYVSLGKEGADGLFMALMYRELVPTSTTIPAVSKGAREGEARAQPPG